MTLAAESPGVGQPVLRFFGGVQEAIESDLRGQRSGDRKENKGSVARALWQAKQLSIPIDAVPLNGRSQPALHLDSVTLPSLAFAGEKFPIDVTFSAPRAGSGEMEIYADGKPLAKTPV